MPSLRFLSFLIVLLTVVSATAQEPDVIVFKSSVEQVAVAAIVRDSRGRLVTNLKASDFELIDGGQKRPLSNVWSEAEPRECGDPHGRQRQHGDKDGTRAGNGRRVRCWVEARSG